MLYHNHIFVNFGRKRCYVFSSKKYNLQSEQDFVNTSLKRFGLYFFKIDLVFQKLYRALKIVSESCCMNNLERETFRRIKDIKLLYDFNNYYLMEKH